MPWNTGVVSYFSINGHLDINVMRQYWITIMKGMVYIDGFIVFKLEMYYSEDTYSLVHDEP